VLVLAGIGVDKAWMGFDVFDMLGWAGVIIGSKSNCCLVELGLWARVGLVGIAHEESISIYKLKQKILPYLCHVACVTILFA
jgi:hypothetical protein